MLRDVWRIGYLSRCTRSLYPSLLSLLSLHLPYPSSFLPLPSFPPPPPPPPRPLSLSFYIPVFCLLFLLWFSSCRIRATVCLQVQTLLYLPLLHRVALHLRYENMQKIAVPYNKNNFILLNDRNNQVVSFFLIMLVHCIRC